MGKTHMHDGTRDTYWDYTYDGVHLTSQTTPQGTVYYAFDGDGRRSVRQLAGTGSWNYSYDNNGRLYQLTSPKDGTTTYNYDVAGRLMQMTKGDGEYEVYSYDAANAERRAALQADERVLQAEGEVDEVLLEGAELGVEIDEAVILLGIIAK